MIKPLIYGKQKAITSMRAVIRDQSCGSYGRAAAKTRVTYGFPLQHIKVLNVEQSTNILFEKTEQTLSPSYN